MSELTFAFSEFPAPGQRTEIVEGIEWIHLPLPFALNHVNCWYLHGGGEACIIDTGLNTTESRECWNSVIADVGWPQKLLVTHFHPDHSGVAAWFAEHGADVLSSEIEWRIIEQLNAVDAPSYQDFYSQWYKQHGVAQTYIDAVNKAGNMYTAKTLAPPSGVTFLDAGDQIELGGRRFSVLTGQGHSPDMLMLFSEADKILIAADQVLPSITPNVSLTPNTADRNPLDSFLRCLERLSVLPEETLVLPSHGLPFTGLHSRIASLQEHHRLRLEEVEQALSKEQTAAELFPVLFSRKLDHQQMSFALGETLAHLSYLENLSRIRSETRDGVTYFLTNT